MEHLERMWQASRKRYTLPDAWFRPHFWDLLMIQLLRPGFLNLPYVNSSFCIEYPSVLSRFCSLPSYPILSYLWKVATVFTHTCTPLEWSWFEPQSVVIWLRADSEVGVGGMQPFTAFFLQLIEFWEIYSRDYSLLVMIEVLCEFKVTILLRLEM